MMSPSCCLALKMEALDSTAPTMTGGMELHLFTNNIYAVLLFRPLITWAGTVDNEPIVKVVWSTSRPCVFFILDTANRIHLWDLGAGDIYPAHTVQFGDR